MYYLKFILSYLMYSHPPGAQANHKSRHMYIHTYIPTFQSKTDRSCYPYHLNLATNHPFLLNSPNKLLPPQNPKPKHHQYRTTNELPKPIGEYGQVEEFRSSLRYV